MKAFLFLFVILYSLSSYGQQIQLAPNYPHKDGIYLSNFEHVHNTPSFPLDFEIRSYILTNLFDPNIIKYLNKTYHRQLSTKQLWAICVDGVSYKILSISKQSEYNNSTGKMALLQNSIPSPKVFYPLIKFTSTGRITSFKNLKKQYIVKFHSNREHRLTPGNLKAMIKDDTDLYQEFSDAKNKKRIMHLYINKYNELH